MSDYKNIDPEVCKLKKVSIYQLESSNDLLDLYLSSRIKGPLDTCCNQYCKSKISNRGICKNVST